MNIVQYTKAASLEEAWELNQGRGAVVLGGCCWLRLSPQRRIAQAIDLSGLGLDGIEELDDSFKIGAMVTLGAFGSHEGLLSYTKGAVKEAVCHIVGTQFRNLATIGGSISGRFGFSDIWTLLLALDAEVDLYKGGRISLADFGKKGPGKDIVTHVIVPKKSGSTAYASLRLNATDFPIIAAAVHVAGEEVRCAIGARPARAEVMSLSADTVKSLGYEQAGQQLADMVTYETNLRGSSEYRHAMAAVLCRRLLAQTMGDDV